VALVNSSVIALSGRINVAIGKPATQSSHSPWSKENDAAGAVTGTMPATYGFHTDEEPAPWWQVDLRETYPIDQIVLHNRRDGWQDRARSVVVDVSEDGRSWRLIHAGTVFFTAGDQGTPLILPLGGTVPARYVRVSLAEKNALHLAQVEVFITINDEVRRRTGLSALPLAGDSPAPSELEVYRIKGLHEAGLDLKIIGFEITYIGRLGNQLLQLINAVCLARRLSVKNIVVFQHDMIHLPAPTSHDGIDFIANAADASDPGLFLAGNFFFPHLLRPLLQEADHDERFRVIHDIVIPKLMKPIPGGDVKYAQELTVHFRAGDIFGQTEVHGAYVQPPLAFYTFLVRRLTAQGQISRVRVVYEDKGNPCVDGLAGFLEGTGIPYRMQSGSLAEDLAALIDSPLLAFGFGTFGVAVALLSRRIDTLFFFDGANIEDYEGIPSIHRRMIVRDLTAGYIKPGEWRNTPEQRRLMIEYPEDGLEITEVSRA